MDNSNNGNIANQEVLASSSLEKNQSVDQKQINDERGSSENLSSKPSSPDELLRGIIRFATNTENIYFLVESSRFRRIPEQVRARSTYGATEDMMKMLGIGMKAVNSTSYAFSNGALAEAGKNKLLDEIPGDKKPKFLRISVNVTRYLVFAQSAKQKQVVINYGTEDIVLSSAQLAHAERLALVSRIGILPYIYVLQNKQGEGLTMEAEGKNCAIAYLKHEDAHAALQNIKKENPGLSLGENRPGDYNEIILNSPLDGILFNPGTPSQTILSRSELEMLRIACEYSPPPPNPVKKMFKDVMKFF